MTNHQQKARRRELLFSVTLDDCRVDTFRAGGKGGQHQNKTSSGVRITHKPSGAVGESREHRSQLQNKKAAFRRMAEAAKFKIWMNSEIWRRDVHSELERDPDRNIKTEIRRDHRWIEVR